MNDSQACSHHDVSLDSSRCLIDRYPNCEAGLSFTNMFHIHFHYGLKYEDRVASILKTFLRDMDFIPSRINPVNETVEKYMEELMHSHGLECEQLKRTIHLSASFIELGCNKCSLEEKKILSMFTWFGFYIDDGIKKNPLPFRDFISCLFRHQPQSDPVLAEFVKVLNCMWAIYDPMAADAIINQTLNFIMGCRIELELEKNPLEHRIERLPWYIRNLSGYGTAYGILPFVKRKSSGISKFIEALPDINYWVIATNDLLSFHKEALANETGTYISNCAQIDNRPQYEICAEIAVELKKARKNIHAVLADNPAALELWKIWEIGYVEWHIMQDRYRLKDLGITI